MSKLFGVNPVSARAGLHKTAFAASVRIHSDDLDRVLTRLEHAIRTRGEFIESYRLLDTSGTERVIFGQACGYVDETTKRTLFAGTLIDLSPQQVADVENGFAEPLDELASVCMSARELAAKSGLKLTSHLLDMTLLDLGHRIASAAKRKMPGWH
ncbi:hypothetical protein [Terrihabitans rhizophilus]|uniref:Uncharacterized protein n=1 Tax=Terrihabitans rhizophilus TaxID=3092662 RepID=A0ABU4RWZ1_9HYPH|nr:hypothetical protein [Terrihabitans sp. PJ23]MDX6807421.1 hypothetical protein [Terrihabitans sp. PJ23]